MKRFSARIAGFRWLVLSLVMVAPACAGSPFSGHAFHCQTCGPGIGGTPYGNTGCGRRYCGAVHDEGHCPDPCDICGRWRGCNGVHQGPDMLAPWQLPPGRGFMNAEQVGYDTRPACHKCEYQFRIR